MAAKLGGASGVRGYLKGSCAVENPFPIDLKGNAYIDCAHCRFYRQTAHRCGLNGSIPEFPERYIGSRCPLNFEEEEIIE